MVETPLRAERPGIFEDFGSKAAARRVLEPFGACFDKLSMSEAEGLSMMVRQAHHEREDEPLTLS